MSRRFPNQYKDEMITNYNDTFLGKWLITETEQEFISGTIEDAYKVQFETSDLRRVTEGV